MKQQQQQQQQHCEPGDPTIHRPMATGGSRRPPPGLRAPAPPTASPQQASAHQPPHAAAAALPPQHQQPTIIYDDYEIIPTPSPVVTSADYIPPPSPSGLVSFASVESPAPDDLLSASQHQKQPQPAAGNGVEQTSSPPSGSVSSPPPLSSSSSALTSSGKEGTYSTVAGASVVSLLASEVDQKSQVYIFIRDDAGQGRGFYYSTDLSARELIDSVVRDAGLDASYRYVLGISELGVYLNEAKPTSLRRLMFVQVCNLSGLSPCFELFCLGNDPSQEPPASSIDIEKLAAVVKEDQELLRLVSPSYSSLILAKCKDEVVWARRAFASARLEAEEQCLAASAATSHEELEANLYLREELEWAFRGVEPAIKEPGRTVSFTCLYPGAKTERLIHCPSDVPVITLMKDLYSKFEGSLFSLQTDISAPLPTSEDFVLKVSGLAEYLLPIDENKQLLKLEDFDYVRRCVNKGEPMELVVVSRSTLHQLPSFTMPSDPTELPSPHVSMIDQMLLRDVWRKDEQTDNMMSMSAMENTRVKLTVLLCRFIKWPQLEENTNKQPPPPPYVVYVAAGLYHGGVLLAPLVFTQAVTTTASGMMQQAMWAKQLQFTLSFKRLPKESRICFTLYAADPSLENKVPESVSDKHVALGWTSFLLLDFQLRLRTGDFKLNLWEGATANPIGTLNDAPSGASLHLMFPTFPQPVVYVPPEVDLSKDTGAVPKLLATHAQAFKRALALDPLEPLTREDLDLLWEYRELVKKTKPRAIAKVLRSVDWTIPAAVREAHRLLATWEPIKPNAALELLDAKYADSRVRAFAVKCLEAMTDAEVAEYCLQLIQALKYEPYHDSPLARFLLTRGLRNKNQVGNQMFWHLKAEMHVSSINERYGVLAEAYLRGCWARIDEFKRQGDLLNDLERVARSIKTVTGKPARMKVLLEGLATIKIDKPVPLPLDPRFSVKNLVVDKCRFMDSKKLPLWVVFENEDKTARPIYVIFKVGDDLRQDILTLQMMRIMDGLWKKQGLDLRMQLYRAVSTGDEVGMLEVVLDSETTNNIVKQQGGTSAVLAEDTVTEWLHKSNTTDLEWSKCVETFMLSCAAYCCATYVLGIGDRHSDNVMISRKGHFFHIDFGHFLGNFKTKLGVKRERAPFKFRPQFAHVFGGSGSPGYKQFEDTCCVAYNALRKNADLFVNLFGLMLSTGIPELQTVEDIGYLRRAFNLELDDLAASQKFKSLLDEALKAKSSALDDMIHHWAHK